jgi:hypothetical protein
MYGSASANDLEWDFAPPVPEDRAADNESLRNKIEMWKLLVDAGVSDEDAAQLVGLPPIKRSAPAPAPAPAAAPAAPPAGDDEPEPDEPAEDDEPDEPDDDREPVAAGAQRVSRG